MCLDLSCREDVLFYSVISVCTFFGIYWSGHGIEWNCCTTTASRSDVSFANESVVDARGRLHAEHLEANGRGLYCN